LRIVIRWSELVSFLVRMLATGVAAKPEIAKMSNHQNKSTQCGQSGL